MSATQNKSWVKPLARTGYAARGIVYSLIGVLAFQLAIGSGGSLEGSRGALQKISQQPFGQILLVIVAIGLIAYAIWRLVEGFLDPENEGHDFKHVVNRIGYVITGISYVLLGGFAFQIVFGGGGQSGGGSQEMTAKLMSAPFGRWLVGLVGVVIIGVGIAQIVIGYKEKFKEHLKLVQMKSSIRKWALRSGKFGLMARGVVYGIIGTFLIQAAVTYNPQQAGGLQKALEELLRQPYGPWLLGVTALGFIAYGIYSQVEARYRRIQA